MSERRYEVVLYQADVPGTGGVFSGPEKDTWIPGPQATHPWPDPAVLQKHLDDIDARLQGLEAVCCAILKQLKDRGGAITSEDIQRHKGRGLNRLAQAEEGGGG